MRVHNNSLNHHEAILANAKTLSLNILDYSKKHYLTKIKTKSSDESCEDFKLLGNLSLMGDEVAVNLYVFNLHEWFQTSPVISVKAKGKNFILETANSVYLLEPHN